MPEFQDVLYEAVDHVARITINRPDVLNAYTQRTLRELTDAVRAAHGDRDVGVLVITGAGTRAFSSGGDVNCENPESFTAGADAMDELNKQLYVAFRDCTKPIIARVHGYAIAGGNHLAYMCDFTVAGESAVFGQNGARVASPAEGWIVSHLCSVVGMKRAKEIWMLCRRYCAREALAMGLINSVVPDAELDAEVDRWCAELLAKSPTVLALLKRSFDDAVLPVREQQDRFKIRELLNPGFFESGEQQEGAAAFLQKREPDFSKFR
jgi:dihydroxynaphthoic acid synthetase